MANRKSLMFILVILICLAGCGPSLVNVVHQKIKLGMSVDEVVSILSQYKGHHAYWLKLIDKKSEKECSRLKPEFEACLKNNYSVECENRIPNYKKCLKNMYKPQEFAKIVNDVASKKTEYTDYEAKIMVLFMGPGFLHNSFEIILGNDAKVKSITEVKHWD